MTFLLHDITALRARIGQNERILKEIKLSFLRALDDPSHTRIQSPDEVRLRQENLELGRVIAKLEAEGVVTSPAQVQA